MGYGATVSTSNKIVIGNTSVTTIGGYANWTNLSDGRFKTNIQENVPGLEFILKLRPVTYHFEARKFEHFLGRPDSLVQKLSESYDLAESQVRTGFIAGNGIARFDGNLFKVYRYNEDDSNSLKENKIRNIYIDSKNNLWAVSFHWLYLYHPDGDWFEHFSLYPLTAEGLNKIHSDENGKLIISGHNSIYQFDIKKKKFSFLILEGLPPDKDYHYFKDDKGIIWIGAEHGMFRYDPKTKKSTVFDSSFFKYENTEKLSMWDISKLTDSLLLIVTYDHGIIIFNHYTYKYRCLLVKNINPHFPLPDNVVNVNNRSDCVYKLNDSILLCSCGGGLSVLNWRTGTVSASFLPDIKDPLSLMPVNIRIYSILKDREGILWFGGNNLEKYNYNDYNFRKYTGNTKKERPFNVFYDLFRTKEGIFFMGTYGGMISLIPNKNQIVCNDEKGFPRINFFSEDEYGKFWCYSAKKNIRVFDIKNDHVCNVSLYPIPYNFTGIYGTMLCDKGQLLVCTRGAGLIIFDTTTKKFTCFNAQSSPPSQLLSSTCTCACKDKNGNIWVGTEKGINKIEKNGITVKQFTTHDPNLLSSYEVEDIKEDNHGIIWFSTLELGIGRIDPKNDTIQFFSIKKGMPSNMFEHIEIGDNDILWASSDIGIISFNVSTFQSKLCTNEIGFPQRSDINTIHYSKYNNKFYILTPSYVLEIESKDCTHNNPFPPTIITGITVFEKEKPLSITKQLNLKYNENFINIQFACLEFHNNSDIKFAYKLDGLDKDWVYCNTKRNAPYTNLLPGNYTFMVKAQSPDGIWNNPTLLSIIIKPPYWQTWWFYLIEAIIATGILFWIIRLYTKRKLNKLKIEFERTKAVSDERQRIASDIHDDLGAGLTSIRLLSEIANLKTGEDNVAKTEIEKIVKSAAHLSENLREIIWTMNSKYDKLDDFIIYIRMNTVEFFDNSNIKYHFYKPDIIPDLLLPGEMRRNLYLCIKESLNNILKHAHATEASCTFIISENLLTIEISDNGIGFDLNTTKQFGNGLRSMKERVANLGGKIEREVSEGTKIILSVNV